MNARRRRFVAEYVKDLNATQAAIRAGYAPNSAGRHADRLVKNGEIAEAIRDAQAELLARLRVDAEWLLRRLVELAEADIAELFDASGRLLPIQAIPSSARRLIAAVESIENSDFVASPGSRPMGNTTRKVRLVDRLRVLEMIGKHISVAAFSERIETVTSTSLADDILAARRRAREMRKSR